MIELIGRGGMATVYLGRDPELGRPVAVNISRRLVCQAAMQTADRDPDRISFSLAQDQIRSSASQPTGLKVSRLSATVRDAVAVLAQARELLTRRDRACPRIVRHRGRRFPSRAAYQGPRSNLPSRCRRRRAA